ncbi:MAG: mannose-phosphate guanylyltransferase/mannose-6-phosphate isomerase [Gammaproteobacteria bacterium]|jgi:mannose-1-phosphate guanylyltransferase|nr:mannose-phosphate guanylyltransferase/mannose-6-phosphate isomerase [Gammaproteobacteria bacterium]
MPTEKAQKIYPIILSGGSGTRLWPLSRKEYPKHLIPLVDHHSLLQKTLLRLEGIACHEPLLICNQQQRFMVAEQLQELGLQQAHIVLEPVGRNTAAAIAIAALQLIEKDPNALMLVLPADHIIKDSAVFAQAVNKALPYAAEGKLVTFGVIPSSPHTGYGYIQRGQKLEDEAYQVAKFVEKPSLNVAEGYLRSGHYYWNSGLFLFKASAYLNELEQFVPDIVLHCQASWDKRQQDLDFIRIEEQAFAKCPDLSIDYAVMEKTQNAVVLPLDTDWSDVGAWSALFDVSDKDSCGNIIEGDVWAENVHNSYLYAQSRLLAVIGVKDHIVVETADAVLVADKSHSEQVKNIVQLLEKSGRSERLYHRVQYRPWGQHELLIESEHFQVRRVKIKPNMMISLQKHKLRSEHWVVVKGIAEVVYNDETHVVKENQSFYVPAGIVHSIKNIGDKLLEFIEVQVGECLKEDDIVRL